MVCKPLDIPQYSITNTLLDEEKKKYFKIQASSAGPASSAYSSEDVKRRKLRDEKEAEAARFQERRKYRIRRSNILQERLAGGLLQRECGHAGFEPARIFAGGLVPRGYHPVDAIEAKTEGPSIFTVSHRPGVGPSTIEFRSGECPFISCSFRTVEGHMEMSRTEYTTLHMRSVPIPCMSSRDL